jgi:hypothetical protein|eukprot:COSAG06_NODE_2326_length_7082_cov_8.240584_2_plen_214_part_00
MLYLFLSFLPERHVCLLFLFLFLSPSSSVCAFVSWRLATSSSERKRVPVTARACLQMKPLDMTIRFNCQAQGTAVITVRIEFADDTLDAVVFSVVKDNVRMMMHTDQHHLHHRHRQAASTLRAHCCCCCSTIGNCACTCHSRQQASCSRTGGSTTDDCMSALLCARSLGTTGFSSAGQRAQHPRRGVQGYWDGDRSPVRARRLLRLLDGSGPA